MYAGDEFYGDDLTSGTFEEDARERLGKWGHLCAGSVSEYELEQADFEREMEDSEDGFDVEREREEIILAEERSYVFHEGRI